MGTSIPRTARTSAARLTLRTTSLRALAVAAHLERGQDLAGPPGIRAHAGHTSETTCTES
jgi:hypothetical protein